MISSHQQLWNTPRIVNFVANFLNIPYQKVNIIVEWDFKLSTIVKFAKIVNSIVNIGEKIVLKNSLVTTKVCIEIYSHPL